MHPALKRAYDSELREAIRLFRQDALDAAFTHFERAHILGQRHTVSHTRVHWWMLRVGVRRRDRREILGQVFRIAAAIVFSRVWVPVGNPGGARVNPLQAMPVPPDLQALLDPS